MTTEQLDDHQDDLERTRVTSRRRLAQESLVDDAERTVIVDRGAVPEEAVVVHRTPRSEVPVEEETVVVSRSVSTEDTVVVERSAPTEDTVVVERSAPTGDTVVVERSGPAEDTVVAERSEPTEDTVVVRGGTEPPRTPSPAPSAPVLRTRGDRRRGIAPPPVPAGFAPAAKPAVGPGAVEAYTARAMPTVRISPAPAGGAEPTRDPARDLPSAARRSQRVARIAVASFAAACVVSVVGLIAIAMLVW
ncbi:hypothetical protein [Salinibacterium sp. ZJ70]|uniref:hypothetical protein n=1 Tax=Salinibacterium sp. ZJ70 TaxID=2708084 RepID=UPI00142186E2|nr:hypothetical protein [Salinibacterium sp. ZJ70]